MKSRFTMVLALPLAVACGGDDAGSAGSGGGAGSGATGGSGGAAGAGGAAGGGGTAGAAGGGGSLPAKPSAGCSGGSATPATGKRTISFGGSDRIYHLHLPPSYQPGTPLPLVLNFHGRTPSTFGEAAVLHEGVSQLDAKGDAAGFIVVRPQGLTDSDGSQTWNAGLCCAEDKTRDDVGFADAILDELEAELCIDTRRVFSTGLSNGGYMSHRLACERADRIAAVAPVAAFNGMSPCNPSRPIGLINFNGTADALVSYTIAKSHAAEWAKRNGCSDVPVETFKNGDSHCDTYDGCTGGVRVVFCTVEDGGHTWPGGADLSAVGLGKTTKDLIANDAMWDFFLQHPLP